MPQNGIYGWDSAGSLWRKLLVGTTGILQVEEQGTPEQHLYGYDGANWQNLLVESSTLKNLRVRLYDGDNEIESYATFTGMDLALRGLVVNAIVRGYNGAKWAAARVSTVDTDNYAATAQALQTAARLFGFNGSTWDRLRTYDTGILKVGRAEVGLLTARMTAVGQVGAAGARKLYWIHENGSAASALYELTDAAAGGGAVVFDHFSTSREGHLITFDPPMEFANGIYLETFTNMTSIVFGYL